MGMDLIGVKPTSTEGEYFRNNIWWWRPLWAYAREVAPDIVTHEIYLAGTYNDGAGLDAIDSALLADKLQRSIDTGRAALYEQEHEAERLARPEGDFARNYPFSVENVQEFVVFLRDCGGFGIH